MELLMGRAEEERRALEAELACMRAAAGDATRQLLLAEEDLLPVRMLLLLACLHRLLLHRPRHMPVRLGYAS